MSVSPLKIIYFSCLSTKLLVFGFGVCLFCRSYDVLFGNCPYCSEPVAVKISIARK